MKKSTLFALVLAAALVAPLASSHDSSVESMALPVCKSSAMPDVPVPSAMPDVPVPSGGQGGQGGQGGLAFTPSGSLEVATCPLGSIGPGGGVIFYDAGELKWWGRYLEAVWVPTPGGVRWAPSEKAQVSIYDGDAAAVQRLRIDAKRIGMGRVNTARILGKYGGRLRVFAAAEVLSGAGRLNDWYLPSKDELNELYNFLALRLTPDQIDDGPVWSSTEAWKNIAWYQLFEDGTQFSDSYILASKGGNKGRTANIKYPGTSFPSRNYRIYAVRAFPPGSGIPPATSFPALTGNTCTNTGPCLVGDIGPAGGVVFYDAGKKMPWGRYLEVSPKTAEKIGWPWRKPGYEPNVDLIYDEKGEPSRIKRVRSKAIGMGAANTKQIVKTYGEGRYAAWAADQYEVNGYSDWFLPSADELDEMYNVLYAVAEPLIGFAPTYYWSSSEYDLKNAWTVLFRSGQRFDREGWFTSKDTGKPNAMRVRPIRAFG